MKKASLKAFEVEQLEVRFEMQVLATPIDQTSCGACSVVAASCAVKPLFA